MSPIKKSAKKALRQSIRRKSRNLIYKNKMRKLIKKFRKLILEKKIKEAKQLLPQIYKILDKAVKVGIIKKNTASRKKSRISRFLQKAEKK